MSALAGSNGSGPSTSGLVPSPRFAVVRRGYDVESVEDYVAQAAAELSRLASDNWDLRRELESARSALAAARASSADQVLLDLKAELATAMTRLEEVHSTTE